MNLKRGYDLPKRLRQDGPYPIVSSSGVTGAHAEPKVQPPGVVTGRYGTLGNVYYIDEPYWPLNTTLYVQDFRGNDERFVAYLLEYLDLAGLVASAAVPGINRNHLHPLRVRLPDRSEQVAISSTIDAFDRLIENNGRRIEVLEEMARLIYREWFVHFRFPGHEDVDLVDSDLGPIPGGWTVEDLNSLARSLTDGDWIETKDQGGTDFRLLQVSNIGVGEFRETANFRYITRETFERLRCTEIAVGDVLISRMPDPIGRAWRVDQLLEPAITAVDVAILKPRSKAWSEFLAQFLNSPDTIARAEAVATGTTRKRISRSVLSRFECVVPPETVLERFADVVGPLCRLDTNLRKQNAVLSDARDLLLPRLVSGELDVSDLDLDLEPAG